jgi:uncharacterized protein YdeI (YjbR/CyaY-like superfamily)
MPENPGMAQNKELPVLSPRSQAAWESWLAAHHPTSTGVWLKIVKKGSGKRGLSYAEAVEVALCFGWIDGQANRFDDDFWVQRFTPRTPRSRWSKINRDKAEKLIGLGRMRSAGLAQVEKARADGRWEAAYDAPGSATVPDDLQQALQKNDKARAFFSTLDGANRYAILYRLQEAKKPDTRARRIEKYVAMLGQGRKIHA